MDSIAFEGFPKIGRLSRECTITEKIDGTNAQILITNTGELAAASRTRLITPEDDNFGFARWVQLHRDDLLALGPGRHFGEWWGAGIQRKYGQTEKRFSLFNTGRWNAANIPSCCDVVPVLFNGLFTTEVVESTIELLRGFGSMAAPGFMQPEGVVVFHTATNTLFKKTLDNDEAPKGRQ